MSGSEVDQIEVAGEKEEEEDTLETLLQDLDGAKKRPNAWNIAYTEEDWINTEAMLKLSSITVRGGSDRSPGRPVHHE